jgi:hypothetical protein
MMMELLALGRAEHAGRYLEQFVVRLLLPHTRVDLSHVVRYDKFRVNCRFGARRFDVYGLLICPVRCDEAGCSAPDRSHEFADVFDGGSLPLARQRWSCHHNRPHRSRNLPMRRCLLLRCNLGKVRLEDVLPKARVKSVHLGGNLKVPSLLLPCPTRELLSMRLAQTLISLASEKEHLLVVLRRQLASLQAGQHAPVDEVHARSVVSSSTALAAFVVPLYDVLLEFRTLHQELPKFPGREQLQVTGTRSLAASADVPSRPPAASADVPTVGPLVGAPASVPAGGRALSFAGGAAKQHARVLSPRLADSCDGVVIVKAPCLPILREAGGVAVACAVRICENLAYEVDHPAQGVRFCPCFCVGGVRA